jgi:hypothetical protein
MSHLSHPPWFHYTNDIWFKSTNYEAPRNSLFSILLLLPLAQIFSSAPCLQISSVYAYIRPVTWETKFHTHARQQQTYGFVHFHLYVFR